MDAGKINLQKASGGITAITGVDGTGNTNLVLPESGTVATTSNIVGFKNYIINGNFDIWQRGNSQTSNGYGSDDRWYNANLVSTKTHSGVGCTDTERALFNANYFSRTVVSSVAGAGNFVTKRTSIEDVTRLAGKTVTLSFWAKADSSKNIWVEFKQFFGTGGSPSSTVLGLYGQAVPLTSTWQKKTITLTLPSIIGKTLGTDGVHTSSTEIQFWFDVGSVNLGRIPTGVQQSGTFDIAQVQLEEGSVATPFEQRPMGLELSLCQRYAKIMYVGVQNQASTVSGQVTVQNMSFPDMRVVPTVTNMSAAYVGSINNSNFIVQNNRIQYEFHYGSINALGSGARADLLSAELWGDINV